LIASKAIVVDGITFILRLESYCRRGNYYYCCYGRFVHFLNWTSFTEFLIMSKKIFAFIAKPNWIGYDMTNLMVPNILLIFLISLNMISYNFFSICCCCLFFLLIPFCIQRLFSFWNYIASICRRSYFNALRVCDNSRKNFFNEIVHQWLLKWILNFALWKKQKMLFTSLPIIVNYKLIAYLGHSFIVQCFKRIHKDKFSFFEEIHPYKKYRSFLIDLLFPFFPSPILLPIHCLKSVSLREQDVLWAFQSIKVFLMHCRSF